MKEIETSVTEGDLLYSLKNELKIDLLRNLRI